MCLRAAIKPRNNKIWNSHHNSDVGPPITSTNSGVNLNGDCSKPRMERIKLIYTDLLHNNHFLLPKFFGEMLKIKPKSI